MLVLTSCATDPNAGKVAAVLTGQPYCLRFERNGKPDTAALFPYKGIWWFYHPTIGSKATFISKFENPPLLIHAWLKGVNGSARWESVSDAPKSVIMKYDCLPSAIYDSRNGGGAIIHTYGHAESERQRNLRLGTFRQ